MNTTAAAAEAHVTVDTIRAWCRIGAVAAIKRAGRWIIDAASLARRIAIGQLKKTSNEAPFVYRKRGGQWTVYAPLATVLSVTTKATRAVAVTKRDGTRKQQAINPSRWHHAAQLVNGKPMAYIELAQSTPPVVKSAAQTPCAECGNHGACYRRADLSGISGLVCRHCKNDPYLSFA